MKLGQLRSAIRALKGNVRVRWEIPGPTNSNGINVPGGAEFYAELMKTPLMASLGAVHGNDRSAETGLTLTADGVLMARCTAARLGMKIAKVEGDDDDDDLLDSPPEKPAPAPAPAPAPVDDDIEDLLA